MNKDTILFGELDKFNDTNSAVLMAITLENDDDITNLNNFLSNEIGFSKGKNLIGVHRILGNVLGDEGRTDYLLEFDNDDVQFNCIARLRWGTNLKWTSDFIENCKDDYCSD